MSEMRKERRPKPARPMAARGVEPPGPRTVFSLSEEETFDLGRRFASELAGGDLVVLEGELGLGKTVFARGIAAGLGIDPADVSSPSFTLVNEYAGGRLALYHADLYRIRDEDDLATLGLEEALDSMGVIVVEWGEKLPPFYRRNAITVRFHDAGEGSRRIEIVPRPKKPAPRGDA